MKNKYSYDIAISYQSKIKAKAIRINEYLQQDNWATYLRAETQQIIFSEKIHKIIYKIFKVDSFLKVLLISENYLEDELASLEVRLALESTKNNPERLIIVNYTQQNLSGKLQSLNNLNGYEHEEDEIASLITEHLKTLKAMECQDMFGNPLMEQTINESSIYRAEIPQIRDVIFNYGTVINDGKHINNHTIVNMNSSNSKETIISLKNWISENYELYSMALLIAAAVFDSLPFQCVSRSAETLFELFNYKTVEEKRLGDAEILEQFGAKICERECIIYEQKIKVEVVKFGEQKNQEEIIKEVWRECPHLHDTIMKWLESSVFQDPIHMARRAADIMGRLVCLDYCYFLDNVKERIQSENNIFTDMVIALNFVSLSRTELYETDLNNLLCALSKEKNAHYLLTGLLVCVERKHSDSIMENMITSYIRGILQETQTKKYGEYMQNIYVFFAAGMRTATFYNLLIENIYNLTKIHLSEHTKKVCELFLELFTVDLEMMEAGEQKEDAVFIELSMCKNEIACELCNIWQTVYHFKQFRQAFYRLMLKYDDMIGKAYELEDFINRVFVECGTAEETAMNICSKIRECKKKLINKFIVREESIQKLNPLGKIPNLQKNECILLYQEGTGSNNSIVISYGQKYSTTYVKHRHYNKKVTLSLSEKKLKHNYRIRMKDRKTRFNVIVELIYSIQDAQAYFFQSKINDDDIRRVIEEIVMKQDGEWNNRDRLEMCYTIQDKIDIKLKRFTGIKFSIPNVNVATDEAIWITYQAFKTREQFFAYK